MTLLRYRGVGERLYASNWLPELSDDQLPPFTESIVEYSVLAWLAALRDTLPRKLISGDVRVGGVERFVGSAA
jgi:hypothetical protein